MVALKDVKTRRAGTVAQPKNRSARAHLAHWSAQAEKASMNPDFARLRKARKAFKALTPAQQWQLAEETAEARSRDFTQLVKTVVAVTAGYKRRAGKDGRERLLRQPCVIFIVRQKWPTADHGQPAQRLPVELWAHADVAGQRVLCAVPTDVQPAQILAAGRAQSRTGIALIDAATHASGEGTLTWPMKFGNSAVMLLAPLHVLSPLPALQGSARRSGVPGRRIVGKDNPLPDIVQSQDFGGLLVEHPAISFDAQLARVLQADAVRDAFAGWSVSAQRPWAQSTAEVQALSSGAGLFVMRPDNHRAFPGKVRGPLRVTYSRNVTAETPLTYKINASGWEVDKLIAHRLLIELQCTSADNTQAGDSGAAVVSPAGDGMTLIGMHIAGSPDSPNNPGRGRCWCIPAWQLFDRLFYDRLPAGAPARASL
jgi:hypothetical protein